MQKSSSFLALGFAALAMPLLSVPVNAARLPLQPTFGTDSCPKPLARPKPDQVFIFSDADGGGICRVLNMGIYPD